MEARTGKPCTVHGIHNFAGAKTGKNIPQDIPETWETQDSRRCYDEYIALCREAHRAGAPLPPMFRTKSKVSS